MKTKVLFVEDEERGVFPYFHALEKIGFECTLVKDGDEVINKLRQEKFDLISIDITFPPGNLLGDKVEPTKAGLKLLEMIRNGRIPNCDPAIKVIVLTAMNDKITENKVRRLGVSAYLNKPIGYFEAIDTFSIFKLENRNIK